jgi:hypothetical protein
MKTKRRLRLGMCGAVLGAACLGLALPALAWDRPLWVKQLGTAELDGGYGVATDAAGNVYIAGDTWGSLGGPNRGGNDAWMAKFDTAGKLRWKQQLGTAESDVANAVATDNAGNVYIAGDTTGSLGGPNRGGVYDAWVAKVDSAGRVLWKRQLGAEDGDDEANRVATDAGNVYIAGNTTGSLVGPNRGGYSDAWGAKYPTGR